MARTYYSRQYYNQLKRKYYEEYRKRQIEYYLYKKKYYEEYRKRQIEYYLYKRKYYEEYRKRQIEYYLYRRRYYKEYLKRQNEYYSYQRKYYEEYLKRKKEGYSYKQKYNKEHSKRDSDIFANERNYDKTYTSQSEFSNSIKTNSVEDNDINDDSIKNNDGSPLEINNEEINLEYKKHDPDQYDNLENTDCKSIEELNNEQFLGEEDDEGEDENQVDKCNNEICKTIVPPKTLPLEETISNNSDITKRLITVKIPVVLTECSIAITIQSSLKLEDAVLEIKHVRKSAYLNQCELIPNSENGNPNTGIVFLAGFITSNIEYSTKENNDKEVLSGKLKHATVKVPFKCTTRVTFSTPPKFKANTSQEEVEILQTSIKECDPYEEEIIGRDIREQSFRLIEFFNEKVFCELVSAEFLESDILENPTNEKCKSPLEQTFHDITENVVLSLTIKLLQNQDVIVSNKA